MNKVKYLVYQIMIGLVIGLLTALTGCATYGGGGYYNNGYSDVGDGYLFGGSYDNGRDVHNYSQRDIERVSAYLGLTISEETAKSTLKKLRHKFQVDSKEQLISASRKLGLHIAIPAKLFKEGSFILNGYELQVKPSRT